MDILSGFLGQLAFLVEIGLVVAFVAAGFQLFAVRRLLETLVAQTGAGLGTGLPPANLPPSVPPSPAQ